MISRRAALIGLVAVPAVIRIPGLLMPVKACTPEWHVVYRYKIENEYAPTQEDILKYWYSLDEFLDASGRDQDKGLILEAKQIDAHTIRLTAPSGVDFTGRDVMVSYSQKAGAPE